MGGGSGPTLVAGQRLGYPVPADETVPQESRAQIQTCDVTRLPPHSVFVTHEVPAAGVQCYFACKYGVSPVEALEYHKSISVFVHTARPDLIPFLSSSFSGGRGGGSSSALKSISLSAVWGYGNAVTDSENMPAPNAVSWTVSNPWTVLGEGVANVWQNTFLYNEEFLSPGGEGGRANRSASALSLCLSPQQAFTLSCPIGFSATSSTAGAPPACALLARTKLFRVASRVMQEAFAVAQPSPGANTAPVICWSTTADFSQFQTGCDSACLDQRLTQVYQLMHSELPSTLWFTRLSWFGYFLQSSTWLSTTNPYLPINTNTSTAITGEGCDTVCAWRPVGSLLGNTFRYSSNDHANDGTQLLNPRLIPKGVFVVVVVVVVVVV
jgi:hypothetical protein